MISSSHKFIFVHIPKCAGTSVRKTLLPYAAINTYQEEYKKMDQGFLWTKRKRYFQMLIENPDFHVDYIKRNTNPDYFMFCFVRHPYSRTVSLWKYLRGDLTFEEFLIWLQDDSRKSFHDLAHIKSCAFYTDLYSEIFTNKYIGKVENIGPDFSNICKKIGIDPPTLPVLNATRHEKYDEYYDNRLKDIVREIYSEDFEYFCYDK